MPEIIKTLTFEDLPTKPPIRGRPRISEDMQQTIALLSAWDGATRRLIKAMPSGALTVVSPPVKGIINLLADQVAYVWQGSDIKTTEVLIVNNPKNTGDVWFNFGVAAAVNTGYLLESGDYLKFSINNLNRLHVFIASDAERVIIIYTE